ncbi:MAG: hypothetical protein V4692_03550, partial [Bdellovibrionota bacterium]
PPLPPEGWQIPVWAIRGVGVVLLLASMGYLAACFLSKKREIHFFKKDFELASGPMALAQLSISSLSWLSIAGIIFVLFGGRVQFNEVLAIFMISGLAAVATAGGVDRAPRDV